MAGPLFLCDSSSSRRLDWVMAGSALQEDKPKHISSFQVSISVCRCLMGQRNSHSHARICNPMNCSPPLSMEFSRQECWNGWPFPSPGDLPDPGIKPASLTSLHWGGFFTTGPPGKPSDIYKWGTASGILPFCRKTKQDKVKQNTKGRRVS